jgi:hypothetical protein
MPEATAGRVWIKRTRMVFAAVLSVLGAAIIPEGLRLGFMTLSRDGSDAPGSGFFPVLVGGFLLVTAFCWGIIEWRAPLSDQIKQDIDPKGHLRVINIAAASIGLALLLQPLGFTLAVFSFTLYTTFTMRMGPEKITWWVNVIVAVVASVGLKLAFEKGLGVTLPNCVIPFLAWLGL